MASRIYDFMLDVDDVIARHGDARVLPLPFMTSVWPNVSFCLSYLLILHFGRKWMSTREAFQIRGLMIFYNFAMVVLNSFLLLEFIRFAWLRGHSFTCAGVEQGTSAESLRLVRVGFLFWFTKVIEFSDTFLFILRKKHQQVTFLHVFHHFAVPLSLWFAIKMAPGGHGVFFATVNSAVHVMMYTYYGIAALGPEYHKFLWWKVWLTRMQIIQFVVVYLHSAQLFYDNSCNYPILFTYVLNVYAVIFFVLFVHYYVKAYRSQAQKAKKS